MHIRIPAALAALLFIATTAHAGSWALSGRVSGTNTTNEGRMFLSVMDENGLPVTGLTAASFKLSNILCDGNGRNCGTYEGTIDAVSEQSGAGGAGVYIVSYKGGQRPGVVTSGMGMSVVRVGSMQVASATPTGVRRKFVQRVQQLFVSP